MKILIISQYFYPESFRINDLALGLKERGHEITVLTGIPNYPAGKFFTGYNFFGPHKEIYQGIKIIRVPLISRGEKQAWRLILNYLSFTLFASILGPIYCRGKFDLVFVAQYSPVTVGIPGIIIKKIKKIPLFFWVQDLWPESLAATGAVKNKLIIKLVDRLVRYIYRQCDRILVQSDGFIGHIESAGIRLEKITYFPNWAEEIYKPTNPDPLWVDKLPKGFNIMFAGNIGAAQDFETILSAAKKLEDKADIHFIILGDGRMRGWVEEEINKRGLAKTFHLWGRHALETMPGFFALADVMLVTLKREPIFSLTIPGKVQSYLACGKPIIAALDGAGAKVVNEAKAGMVVNPEDSDALVKAILRMYAMDKKHRQELGANGLSYYQKYFNRRVLLDSLEKIFI